MENEKNFGYTLLLGVCMLISLILIGKMLLYRPVPIYNPIASGQSTGTQSEAGQPGEENKKLQLQEDDVARMIEEHLPQDFPVKGISVNISKDGTILADGTVYKDKLTRYISSDGMMRSALILMPSEFTLKSLFSAASGEDGTLTLTPQQISVDGFDFPVSVFSSALTNALNQAVNAALRESFPEYHKICLEDGMLELMA